MLARSVAARVAARCGRCRVPRLDQPASRRAARPAWGRRSPRVSRDSRDLPVVAAGGRQGVRRRSSGRAVAAGTGPRGGASCRASSGRRVLRSGGEHGVDRPQRPARAVLLHAPGRPAARSRRPGSAPGSCRPAPAPACRNVRARRRRSGARSGRRRPLRTPCPAATRSARRRHRGDDAAVAQGQRVQVGQRRRGQGGVRAGRVRARSPSASQAWTRPRSTPPVPVCRAADEERAGRQRRGRAVVGRDRLRPEAGPARPAATPTETHGHRDRAGDPAGTARPVRGSAERAPVRARHRLLRPHRVAGPTRRG